MIAALWIGDAELPEFAETVAVLRRRTQLNTAATIDDALRRDTAADWDVAVVADAIPAQQPAAALDALRRRCPTLPIVRLSGPGCDGEGRSHVLEPMHALRWLEAPAAFDEACEKIARGECPVWGRPITLGPEERLLQTVAELPTGSLAGLRVGIWARDAAVAAWLAGFGKAEGAAVVDRDESSAVTNPCDAVLWQVPDDAEAAAVELGRLRSDFPRAGIVALVAFPRPEQVGRLRDAGVNQIIALPASAGLPARAMAATARPPQPAIPQSD
jgi:hypothetical protein